MIFDYQSSVNQVEADILNQFHRDMEDSVAVTPLKRKTTGSEAMDSALDVVARRHEQYGPPEENLREIGRAWAAYLTMHLGVYVPDLGGRQVCALNGIAKWIRDGHYEQEDNLVDQHGYTYCAERCTRAEDEIDEDEGA